MTWRRGRQWMSDKDYPWYISVEGDEIRQGDILLECPLIFPPNNLACDSLDEIELDVAYLDVIVVSQSCDLVKGREKLEYVLLCSLTPLSAHKQGELSTPKGRENARRGYLPGVHMLNSCQASDMEREISIVDFRRIYSLPIGLIREVASKAGPRLRLLPPYREHMSQSLARYFMRVGLPADIQPFGS